MTLFNGTQNNNEKADAPYSVDPTRWFKSYPYGFAFFNSKAKSSEKATETFWLPIAPNNISVTTHYATNVITTLYGVAEEHTPVRFYDIVISGNTGIAPKYTVPFSGASPDGSDTGKAKNMSGVALPNPKNPGAPSVGRRSFLPTGGLTGKLGGFLPEISNTIKAATNLVKGIAGGKLSNETGISPEQSGYYAFHNFYKFMLRYKMDVSGSNGSLPTVAAGAQAVSRLFFAEINDGKGPTGSRPYPLQFLNYKDGIKYDVVPLSFVLTRSAENPMLYNYSIRLRAFNLRNVSATPTSSNKLAELGLGGLDGSLFSKMTGIAGNASTLISGIRGKF